MKNYIHKVQYYETDKMGITHHSNYIRWMEEARVNFLNKIGYGFDKLENEGVSSPVIDINCTYKNPTTFNDDVEIEVVIEEYTGVRLELSYKMTNLSNDKIAVIGKSKHCFINTEGRPVNLKKVNPKFDEKIKSMIADTKAKGEVEIV